MPIVTSRHLRGHRTLVSILQSTPSSNGASPYDLLSWRRGLSNEKGAPMRSTESDRATVSDIERSGMRRMLEGRQRELLHEIHSRVRDVREEGSTNDRHVTESGDAEAGPEHDLAFALIQMKAETADKIAAALRRFDEGSFGCCLDCEDPIPLSRLRALPFAVRCRDCEEAREEDERRGRRSPLISNRLQQSDTLV